MHTNTVNQFNGPSVVGHADATEEESHDTRELQHFRQTVGEVADEQHGGNFQGRVLSEIREPKHRGTGQSYAAADDDGSKGHPQKLRTRACSCAYSCSCSFDCMRACACSCMFELSGEAMKDDSLIDTT